MLLPTPSPAGWRARLPGLRHAALRGARGQPRGGRALPYMRSTRPRAECTGQQEPAMLGTVQDWAKRQKAQGRLAPAFQKPRYLALDTVSSTQATMTHVSHPSPSNTARSTFLPLHTSPSTPIKPVPIAPKQSPAQPRGKLQLRGHPWQSSMAQGVWLKTNPCSPHQIGSKALAKWQEAWSWGKAVSPGSCPSPAGDCGGDDGAGREDSKMVTEAKVGLAWKGGQGLCLDRQTFKARHPSSVPRSNFRQTRKGPAPAMPAKEASWDSRPAGSALPSHGQDAQCASKD